MLKEDSLSLVISTSSSASAIFPSPRLIFLLQNLLSLVLAPVEVDNPGIGIQAVAQRPIRPAELPPPEGLFNPNDSAA
ncbi:unnamed protein product [Protopolystoma xenopodis]|uniref:Uncharacterized protein n=1 Tax=Protopolystoma xenopodis TaxID=117903 RepID=A0A448WYY5_9PLAT|nr:unnamed protein product [Protopolystoma xenopodis]